MSGTFAGCAVRLAGLSTRVFGWTPDQFWQATPAELAAVLHQPGDPETALPLTRTELKRLLEGETHD